MNNGRIDWGGGHKHGHTSHLNKILVTVSNSDAHLLNLKKKSNKVYRCQYSVYFENKFVPTYTVAIDSCLKNVMRDVNCLIKMLCRYRQFEKKTDLPVLSYKYSRN